MTTPDPLPLSKHLKCATTATHGVLDRRIMAFGPFTDFARYTAFVQVQYRFHRDVAALFDHPELNRLLPGLQARRRAAQVAQDLVDLGAGVPTIDTPPVFVAGADIDIATALGWLYTEEGSNLGAAFLFKLAAKLGFDEQRGARHLAPHPEGRAPSWHAFTAQLDAAPLDDAGRDRAAAGAQAAFTQVLGYVDDHCPLPAPATAT